MTASGPQRAELHHVGRGEGVPVLALHGWMPDHRILLTCLEEVFDARPGYLRLYPDLPGMGASPAGSTITGSDDVLRAVLDLVDTTIGDRPFLLVGESYGGYLARGLVAARPDQVLGLALVCPVGVLTYSGRTLPPRTVLRPDPALFDGLDPALAEGFAAMAVVQTAQTLRRYREEIQPGVAAADGEALRRIQRRWALDPDPDGPDAVPFARPTLILLGRQDDSVGYADQLRLLPRFPRATLAVLDVAGHNLQIEQPELFTALMREWVDRVAAESG